MRISDPSQDTLVNEVKLMLETLPLDGARLIELGCGRAEKTRTLAESGRVAEIVALEVDAIQHEKNLALTDLPNVHFVHAGAEAIPAPDASFDVVLMLKSLHHVPMPLMDSALAEVARVLKPGGLAWISEPVYAGEMNAILSLFHDEKEVREAAFAALCRVVEQGALNLERQIFFQTRSHFDDFAHFEQRMIRVTHLDHVLSPELYAAVKARFESNLTPEGVTFFPAQRVDLLRKP